MKASSESGLCATLISLLDISWQGYNIKATGAKHLHAAAENGLPGDAAPATKDIPLSLFLLDSLSAQRSAGDGFVNEDLQCSSLPADGLRRENDRDSATVAGIEPVLRFALGASDPEIAAVSDADIASQNRADRASQATASGYSSNGERNIA